LIAADGTKVTVPLASLGIAGGNWVRIRVGMDLRAQGGAGLGAVEVQNLTTGTPMTPAPGLQAVPLGLNPNAADATNPSNWSAVWLHFEGATYGLDNFIVYNGHARAVPYGDGCGNPPLGLRGFARPVLGTTAIAETFAIPPAGVAAAVLFGAVPIDPGLSLAAIGMPTCFLLPQSVASVSAPVVGATLQTALPLPNTASLAGSSLYLQSTVVAPGANALGVLSSNGLRWILDRL
jgi:hypothetical protein